VGRPTRKSRLCQDWPRASNAVRGRVRDRRPSREGTGLQGGRSGRTPSCAGEAGINTPLQTMEIGRDWDATWRNKWPQEADVPGFKQTMLNFFHASRRGFAVLKLCLCALRPATVYT
jgi:hypothetical protein